LVIDRENDLGYTSLGQSLNLMAQDWKVAEVHQGLWDGESQGSESRTKSANKNQSFHLKIVFKFKSYIKFIITQGKIFDQI